MRLQKLLILIASIVGILSTFLNWFKGPFGINISGISSEDSYVAIILLIVIIVLVAIKDRVSILTGKIKIATVVLGVLNLLLGLFEIINASQTTYMGQHIVSPGIGLIIYVIASIAIIVLPFINLSQKIGTKD
ncbi:hypothetical protein [Companilactobacillus metriopterae]|uniref:hypothetical protein n=1 Tax=Companilactobacillus metriopterae TaxID=1909267 RepID=UPI00100C17A2|nr:hypothetical protein [Companilactobacillus metriopterae]